MDENKREMKPSFLCKLDLLSLERIPKRVLLKFSREVLSSLRQSAVLKIYMEEQIENNTLGTED